MRANPAFVYGVDRQGIEMVPPLPALAFDQDQVGRLQHFQMLHHGAAVYIGEMLAQCTGG